MSSLFLVVLIAAALIIIPLSIAQSRKADEAWATAAKKLRLSFQKAGFLQSRQISGRIDDFRITVDTYTVRRGKNNSTTYTRFRLGYSSLRLGLQLTEEGFFTGVTKFFGAQDIVVGNPQFDDSMLIKGNRPQQIKEFLTSARQMRIDRFFSAHRGATLDDQEIYWRRTGVMKESDQLVQVVRSMVRLASHLTSSEQDQTLQHVLDAQGMGRTEEAIQALTDYRQSSPPHATAAGAEEHLLEGELLYMADRPEEAQAAFARAAAEAPDDTEIAEWIGSTQDGDSEPPTQPNRGDQVADLEPDTVCKTLFESGLTSYRVTRMFEERFAGKTVHWSGVLRRAEKYSYDLVFGSSPGCRAVVEIHELNSTGYGGQTVSAVVQFPPEFYEDLRESDGQTVSFAGELKKVDSLMRNIYIRSDAMS